VGGQSCCLERDPNLADTAEIHRTSPPHSRLPQETSYKSILIIEMNFHLLINAIKSLDHIQFSMWQAPSADRVVPARVRQAPLVINSTSLSVSTHLSLDTDAEVWVASQGRRRQRDCVHADPKTLTTHLKLLAHSKLRHVFLLESSNIN
jgi:hypothetical protein